MRDQLKTVGSAAKGGQARFASMVANVADIPKPQALFAEEIDNDRDSSFVPRLTSKPNAVVPLNLAPCCVTSTLEGNDDTLAGGGSGSFDTYYPHPYEAEIRSFHYLPAQV
ncbi:unnamed protein product, partial [Choristocarpus tenellus]